MELSGQQIAFFTSANLDMPWTGSSDLLAVGVQRHSALPRPQKRADCIFIVIPQDAA
jgi:hypothetical protein